MSDQESEVSQNEHTDGAEAAASTPDAVTPGESKASPETGDAAAPEETVEPATPEEVAETGVEFVSGLLESMELTAEVTSSVEGDSATIDVAGDDLGVLIGRRGQTLDALQELARTAVQRRLRSRVRLMVDVEGYRARRRDTLADYARSIADRAKERGTEIELEPMSSWDRKIVHDAVSDIEGVSSFSEGVDPNRKVVIRAE